jgi:hypothetical protein
MKTPVPRTKSAILFVTVLILSLGLLCLNMRSEREVQVKILDSRFELVTVKAFYGTNLFHDNCPQWQAKPRSLLRRLGLRRVEPFNRVRLSWPAALNGTNLFIAISTQSPIASARRVALVDSSGNVQPGWTRLLPFNHQRGFTNGNSYYTASLLRQPTNGAKYFLRLEKEPDGNNRRTVPDVNSPNWSTVAEIVTSGL